MSARPYDGIDSEIDKAAGLFSLRMTDTAESQYNAAASPGADEFVKDVPSTFSTRTRLGKNQMVAETRAIYTVAGSPALTINAGSNHHIVAWDPPIFKAEGSKSLLEIWGGSAAPYALAAGALNSLEYNSTFLHAGQIDIHQTMSVTAWRTGDGHFHLLAADLEEGLRDDADRSRHVDLVLPTSWGITNLHDVWSDRKFTTKDRYLPIDLDQARSELLTNAQ
jgi:hypothetical protein